MGLSRRWRLLLACLLAALVTAAHASLAHVTWRQCIASHVLSLLLCLVLADAGSALGLTPAPPEAGRPLRIRPVAPGETLRFAPSEGRGVAIEGPADPPGWSAWADAFPRSVVHVAVGSDDAVVGALGVGLTAAILGEAGRPRQVACFFDLAPVHHGGGGGGAPRGALPSPTSAATRLADSVGQAAVDLGAEAGCTYAFKTRRPIPPPYGTEGVTTEIDLLFKLAYRISLTVEPLPYGSELRHLSPAEAAPRWREWFVARPLFPIGDVDRILQSAAVVDTLYAAHPPSRSEAALTIYDKTATAPLGVRSLPWAVRLYLAWAHLWWGAPRIKAGQPVRIWSLVGVHLKGFRAPELAQHLLALAVERADLEGVPVVMLPNLRDPRYDVSHLMPTTVSLPVVVRLRTAPGRTGAVDLGALFPDPRL